jgi:hypothetical protein
LPASNLRNGDATYFCKPLKLFFSSEADGYYPLVTPFWRHISGNGDLFVVGPLSCRTATTRIIPVSTLSERCHAN